LSTPIITLLSDLGTRDASVPVVKAILMQHVPAAVIVDISHNVAQYDLQQAAYLILTAYRHFPKGTVHILQVDALAGNAPRILLAEKDGHYFIAPDNGILPLSFETDAGKTWLCFELDKPFTFSDWVHHAGSVAATVRSGKPLPYSVYGVKKPLLHTQHKLVPGGVECNVLYIDRYQNVVLDITKAQFDALVKNKPFRIKVMRAEDINTISTGYNDVPKGAPLCRFNNAGFLEIALNHAPAATLLGLGANNSGNLRYQAVKIFFSAE
jgi:S-adenosyl-L-methionine hydrolase (adenosine-forming)